MKIERLGEQIRRITAMKIDSMLNLYNKNNKAVIHERLERLTLFSVVFDNVEGRHPEDIKSVWKEFHTAIRELETRISDYRVQVKSKANATNAVAKINDLRAEDLNAIDRAIQTDESDKAREGASWPCQNNCLKNLPL